MSDGPREELHRRGPPGYDPCTREWPHDGPCAHPIAPLRERKGIEITTDWYDGPLRSVRLVEFNDGHRMVQVHTVLGTVGEPFTIGYDDDVRPVTVRFTRDELLDMLNVIDGKPIKDWNDEVRISVLSDEVEEY